MTRSAPPEVDLAKRDLTLDLARVACVLLVVVIHLLQVGIGVDEAGAFVVTRPAEMQDWFALATWAGQIMPLFFVVGGFASAAGWRSHTARGGTGTAFVRGRALRLAQPALPLFAFFAIVLGAATILQLAPDIVAPAAIGAGSPLWFLAAYLLCQTCVPLMMRLDEAAPRLTLALLAAGVVIVDALRYSTGIEDIGLLNLAFVWLFCQQLGIWYFRGVFDRARPVVLAVIAAGCYLALWPLTAVGPYYVSMLGNLNPPTLPLIVLGVAQACLLRLLKRPLTAVMDLRAARAVVFVVGSRLMTIYLWHLPVILAVTGLTLLIPGAAPTPATPAWWWSRISMFIVVMGLLYALSLVVGRWEAIPPLPDGPGPIAVGVGVVLAFVPAFLVMELGLDVVLAVVGAVAYAVAVTVLRRTGRREPRADAPQAVSDARA
ncbi:acyltransferase family protein [Microbacterium sp. SSM24]|uniref:acyltransferase family protein n=1 Tax=Microbacterium sp. SSM24 TaxID=2991714 RepID=UPI002225EBE8|nr:acyltransferase [Microbacterium sp. SSM24]MCW3494551.1 acyltransferase [Microbacterium sp. SSM24]